MIQTSWLQTLVESHQWLKNWYLSLPNQALCIIKDRARTAWLSLRIIKIMWLSGISGHDVGGLTSTISWRLYSAVLSQVGTHPDVILDVARTFNSNKKHPKQVFDWSSLFCCECALLCGRLISDPCFLSSLYLVGESAHTVWNPGPGTERWTWCWAKWPRWRSQGQWRPYHWPVVRGQLQGHDEHKKGKSFSYWPSFMCIDWLVDW